VGTGHRPGYLTDERDLDALVCGVQKAREIAACGPLADVLAEEWSPGGTVHSRDGLRHSVRDTLESLYHPGSSCRMGIDGDAVVDPTLRVHGLDGLRVVDASAMPTLVRGDTDAPDDHDRRAGGRPDHRPHRRPRPHRHRLKEDPPPPATRRRTPSCPPLAGSGRCLDGAGTLQGGRRPPTLRRLRAGPGTGPS
jgi:hypothetical protein